MVDPAVTNITLPEIAGDANVHASVVAAEELFNRINQTRIDDGLEPLVWSQPMSLVATTRALTAYQTGLLVSPSSIEERLISAGVQFRNADERLVLAATGEGLAGVMDATGTYTSMGVGIVEGPYGLIAVVVTAV